MTLWAEPALHDAPHDADAGARVEAARQDRRQLGDDLAERVGEVLGQVRARGVAAGAGEGHVEVVGRAGDRALAQADLARRRGWGRSAGRRSARRRRGRRARSATAHRPASPPRPAGRAAAPGPASRPCSWARPSAIAAPDQGAGVDVVAAGVGDAVDGAHPGVVGQVGHRQRVEVGAQRRRGASVADLGDQAGAGQLGDPPARLPGSARRPAAVVRDSRQDSSGWACRSRRSPTSSSSHAATADSITAPIGVGVASDIGVEVSSRAARVRAPADLRDPHRAGRGQPR